MTTTAQYNAYVYDCICDFLHILSDETNRLGIFNGLHIRHFTFPKNGNESLKFLKLYSKHSFMLN